MVPVEMRRRCVRGGSLHHAAWRRRGGTLVELFVWMAIAAILGTILISFVLAANYGIAAMRSVSYVQLQAVQSLRSVFNDVRDASCVCNDVGAGPVCIGAVVPSPPYPGDTLCLLTPAIKNGWPSPMIMDVITYSYNDATNQLTRQLSPVGHTHPVPPVSTSVCDRQTNTWTIANEITDVLFTPTGFNVVTGGAVTVSINAEYGEWGRGGLIRTFPFSSASARVHNRNMNSASVFE